MKDKQCKKLVTISVVSHKQSDKVTELLNDLKQYPEIFSVILTYNLPEVAVAIPAELKSRTKVVWNSQPKGFGENHNTAFLYCTTQYFCVLNPDINFIKNPFSELIMCLKKNDSVALAAPLILNLANELEDSFRDFPAPKQILTRVLGLKANNENIINKQISETLYPEWVAGMFMLFRSEEFQHIGGFDEGFFMYCEDVDICLRLRMNNKVLVVSHLVHVIHNARRESRKNFRYMIWHIQSMIRLWIKYLGRLPKR